MKIEQVHWPDPTAISPSGGEPNEAAQLALVFGSPKSLRSEGWYAEVRRRYPNAHVCGCSTAGEIAGTEVLDDSIVVTAVELERTRLKVARADVKNDDPSCVAGRALAQSLVGDDLRHVIVFSDGLHVNGSRLTLGLRTNLPAHVAVTGGLSADGDRFEHTLVCADGEPEEGVVCGIGFYGDALDVGYGSLGGWDPFGPERRITRSKENVLYELDGQSALSLYKKYLGEHAEGLPATALLFPLSLRDPDGDSTRLVRTVLSVDEEAGTMTFAGDLPEGHLAQLMKANFERLIEGAHGAARISKDVLGETRRAELALLISCVGRRLVLKQRTEEEIEGVREVVGDGAILTGFYSYGEICPVAPSAGCELHNQTMTITTISER